MKLMYAPQSPFARKVRAAAIELGFADRLDLVYAEVVPRKENETRLRPAKLRWQAWLDDQWNKIWSGLAWFERDAGQMLQEGLEPIDISQLALACCLGYIDFRYPERKWASRFPGSRTGTRKSCCAPRWLRRSRRIPRRTRSDGPR